MPTLVGKEIGSTGFGLMGLTWRPEPVPQEQAFEAMKAALNNGMNFWNGGEFYGPPEYNSLVLLERYFAKYPEDAEKVVLSIKGGVGAVGREPDGSPENTRRTLDSCIAQLKGRKKIDIFEFARRDQNVPMKTTFDVVQKEYIDTGKIGGISLSEVRAETIHEAVKIIKVVGVEVELSLFSRHIFDNGVAEACAKYDIPIIAYSPIGRGWLSGTIKTIDDVQPQLRVWPWFQPPNFAINLELAGQVAALAKRKGVTPAQLAIAWTKRLSTWREGAPKTIIPIPGATTAARVTENAVLVELEDEEMAALDETLGKFPSAGERYPEGIPTNT
ncbi:putative aldo/keto reductase [Annulohypoxylon maeteangense]|uniref:putative aldo/keto reductase n=1 Tax=Annulohypoxylon maeteangense TaxID=1927788 RepID=UPI002007AC8A|nr:putative aldo/keto reductase [Annulohypoxylon maeteangense]KAI0889397.1 putative aldo/keto reductase [Annulohypoxylon maeteangense]